jgi:hypothetical protein
MGRLGQLLVQAGALQACDLERGLREHRRTGGKLGEVLVRLSLVTELQVTEALARQLNLPVEPLEVLPPFDPAILARIPAELAHAASVLPLELTEEGRVLVVATDGPLRGERLEQVRSSARCWVVPRLSPESALRRALQAAYGPRAPSGPTERIANVKNVQPVPDAETERGGQVVPLSRGHGTTDLIGVPQHPEVRALVELLLERGLLSASDVRQAFSALLPAATPHAASQENDKESS